MSFHQTLEPSSFLKEILTNAVAIGNAMARAIGFAPRKPSVSFYPDRKWSSPFAGMSFKLRYHCLRSR